MDALGAYLLKEQRRQIYRLPAMATPRLLDGRTKRGPDNAAALTPFRKLARTVTGAACRTLATRPTRPLKRPSRGHNTQIRLLTRSASTFTAPTR
ncbi:MAG: hypothetical protein DLM61_13825 [Pseudonocardiales bacterium]|nr:MAG: hypothetical protein DLM61_13825 [Pseudonocardiales bacterium]